jgi:intracellular sulfur oxidation DsrE/DsrF family protein
MMEKLTMLLKPVPSFLPSRALGTRSRLPALSPVGSCRLPVVEQLTPSFGLPTLTTRASAKSTRLAFVFAFLIYGVVSHARVSIAVEEGPWGNPVITDTTYRDQKVVYDVAVDSVKALRNVMSRASYLSRVNGDDPFENSIVLVLHGDEIHAFSKKNYPKNKELMALAYSMTLNGTIKFKMCRVAAANRGYKPTDILGFIEIVPMADAEIIRLEDEKGYAYMR